jgi:predicted HAD superfamily Cof-like phosphohydrolase
MTEQEVKFLVKMICEEAMELLATVCMPEDDILLELHNISHQSKLPLKRLFNNDIELMAEQVDAMIDIDYFCGNAAAKVGLDPDQVFDLVHEANMRKVFPDGEFHAENGKIMKPPGWKAPDVESLVGHWTLYGTHEDRD